MTSNRIEIHPEIMMGKPVIRGTRITVELILRKLAERASEKELLEDYPHLATEDLRAAVSGDGEKWPINRKGAGFLPQLIPTGNVDEVLLTGRSRGKDLTLRQAVGLAVLGLFLVFRAGLPSIFFQFSLQEDFDNLHVPFTKISR